MEVYEIIKGENTPVHKVSVKDLDTLDDNWQCKMYVKESLSSDSPSVIEKSAPKATDSSHFRCFLTPDETMGLTKDRYYWIFELTNTMLPEPVRKEIQNKLVIRPSGV